MIRFKLLSCLFSYDLIRLSAQFSERLERLVRTVRGNGGKRIGATMAHEQTTCYTLASRTRQWSMHFRTFRSQRIFKVGLC
ncbi:hypothetical protein BJ170DRAFT_462746 [Xylariales sp. AK1849]|nr:hypothetical protein BJ170DRAFT_462746 [Xylariales sp. AK1849]